MKKSQFRKPTNRLILNCRIALLASSFNQPTKRRKLRPSVIMTVNKLIQKAHGDQPDIKADFKSLRDFPTVLKFLKEAVKLSLLLGLKDPESLEYLKKI
jgi:hypothetical protein